VRCSRYPEAENSGSAAELSNPRSPPRPIPWGRRRGYPGPQNERERGPDCPPVAVPSVRAKLRRAAAQAAQAQKGGQGLGQGHASSREEVSVREAVRLCVLGQTPVTGRPAETSAGVPGCDNLGQGQEEEAAGRSFGGTERGFGAREWRFDGQRRFGVTGVTGLGSFAAPAEEGGCDSPCLVFLTCR